MLDTTETQRQRELDLYRIVDSVPEAAYDDIARLASMLCDAPVALVSLIDRDRQWTKGRVGDGSPELPRELTFCNHAIRTPATLFEVHDLSADARFAANPLVTDEAGPRFYAGMPLVTPNGSAVGTVCVLDGQPRTLSAAQRSALEALARITMNLMEARRRQREFERVEVLEPQLESRSAQGYWVALFEMQQYAAHVGALGERAVERRLHELDALLEPALQPGDSVNRVTGSGEYIALLHGGNTAAVVRALCSRVDDFAGESGFQILHGVAGSQSSLESPEAVYLRADAALGAAKDAACGARRAA